MTRDEAKDLLYDKHGEDVDLIDRIYDDFEKELIEKSKPVDSNLCICKGFLKPNHCPVHRKGRS